MYFHAFPEIPFYTSLEMLLTIVAADLTHTVMQTEMMLRVVGVKHPITGAYRYPPERISDAFGSHCSPFRDYSDVCDWPGVECTDGVVRKIQWWYEDVMETLSNVELNSLLLRWLPATIRRIEIDQNEKLPEGLRDAFESAFLPRDAIAVVIRSCGLKGTVEMSTLPQHIETLGLPGNSITGTVSLLVLPRTLKRLDLTVNPIETVVVDNQALLETFEHAFFGSAKSILKVEIHGERFDPRVSIARWNIHVLPSINPWG